MWSLLGKLVVVDWVVRRLYPGGLDVGGRGVERSRRRGGFERGLMMAVEAGDYGEFERLYRLEYPLEDERRIVEEWEWRVECSEEN